MTRCIIFTLLSTSIFSVLAGCGKKNDSQTTSPPAPIVDVDSGKFLATVGGEDWHPIYHNAVYYPEWQQLYLFASDTSQIKLDHFKHLYGGVLLDSSNPLKKYALEPNGENVFALVYSGPKYTDANVQGVGGYFSVTKFDTINKKISGTLQFTADGLNGRKDFSSTIIEDIPLRLNNQKYYNNYITYTAQGVNTINVLSKDIDVQVYCEAANKDEALSLNIYSILAGLFSTGTRNLKIQIPLSLAPGKYPIYAVNSLNMPCDYTRILLSYEQGVDSYKSFFNPVAGEFNITKIDRINRKLEATFSVTVQSINKNLAPITLTNAQLHLNKWLNIRGQ